MNRFRFCAAFLVLSAFSVLLPTLASAAESLAQTTESTTVTSAPASSTTTLGPLTGPDPGEGGGVIPKPNSGVAPTDPGDRGGWAQLLLWGLLSTGLAVVGIRIAWGIRRHNANNPVP